jgi:hypothetical protein
MSLRYSYHVELKKSFEWTLVTKISWLLYNHISFKDFCLKDMCVVSETMNSILALRDTVSLCHVMLGSTSFYIATE